MAKVSLATIKNWFKTGLKPTQAQFWDTWDSFRHKDDAVPAAEVGGLDTLLAGKAESTHLADPNAHPNIVSMLRDEMDMAGLSAQLLEIVLPPEEVVDPASNSIIEKLNSWLTAPLVIQQSSLVYVRYWHSELSDGDAATIRTWAMFMLEPGTYGSGGQPIPQVKVINDLSFGAELEMGTRRIKLSTIPALTQASGSSIATQDQFNKRVDDLLNLKSKPSFKPFGLRLLPNQSMSWGTDYNWQLLSGEEFRGFGNITIVQDNAVNWTNLVEWNSNFDLSNPNLKYLVLVSYSNIGGAHKINITLQETISNVSFRQWNFSPNGVIPTNNIEFSFWLRVVDLAQGSFQAAITMNGKTWSLTNSSGIALDSSHSLLEYVLQQGAWGQSNFPAAHRVNFFSNFPGSVEIYELGFGYAGQGNGYENPTTIWDDEELILDYVSSRFTKRDYFTKKGFVTNTLPISASLTKEITGRFYYRDEDGSMLPATIPVNAFQRGFDRTIEAGTLWQPGDAAIANAVLLIIKDNTVIVDVTDSYELELTPAVDEILLSRLPFPFNIGLSGNAPIVFLGYSWDNGQKVIIKVKPDGIYAKLEVGKYQDFFGGEMLAFRIEWKMK